MSESPISGRTVLVTGGTGFIGSHLCRVLEGAGCHIHSVSRRAESKDEGNVRYWKGDLADIAAVRRILTATRPELIFHLASHVSGSRDLGCVLPTFHDNLASTVNVLTVAAEIGCRRIVLAGSLEEATSGPSAAIPCSPYAAAKLAASAYGRMFHSLYGLPVVIARLFMVYGPGQSDDRKLIPYVISSLLKKEAPQLTSGRRLVDWIFVQDAVEGVIAAAQAPGIEGKTIDVGSGRLASIRDVVEQLVEFIDPGIKPVFGALPERPMEQVRTANVAESKLLTGWNPRFSLDEGLKQTALWYERALKSGAEAISWSG